MMIILVNPPHPPGYVSNKDTAGGFGQIYADINAATIPPLDLPYIGAVLKKDKIPVKIYDCPAIPMNIEELICEINTASPKIVGVRTSTPTVDWDLSLIRKIKEDCDVKIVVFGPHATLSANEIILNDTVDAVVLGEPEYVFSDLIKKKWQDVKGLVYKRKNKIHTANPDGFIEDLDSLPFPSWEMMPINSYSVGDYVNNQTPFFTILSSRGCPFGCTYCPYIVAQGKKWRKRSAENVLAEIRYLVEQFGMKGLLFRDPEFSLDKDRVAKICQGIIDEGIKISWRCETRADTTDEKLLALMAQAGCVGINFGIESASEKVLAGVGRKSIPQEEIISRVNICKELGIKTFCFFIIGLPDDDIETIIDTINLALKLNATAIQFTHFTPYYGTELRTWYEENNFIEDKTLSSLTSFNPVVRTKKLSRKELQKFVALADSVCEIALDKKTAKLEFECSELKIMLREKTIMLDAIHSTLWYKFSVNVSNFLKHIGIIKKK